MLAFERLAVLIGGRPIPNPAQVEVNLPDLAPATMRWRDSGEVYLPRGAKGGRVGRACHVAPREGRVGRAWDEPPREIGWGGRDVLWCLDQAPYDERVQGHRCEGSGGHEKGDGVCGEREGEGESCQDCADGRGDGHRQLRFMRGAHTRARSTSSAQTRGVGESTRVLTLVISRPHTLSVRARVCWFAFEVAPSRAFEGLRGPSR